MFQKSTLPTSILIQLVCWNLKVLSPTWLFTIYVARNAVHL